MNIKKRLLTYRLIDGIRNNETYSEKLGVEVSNNLPDTIEGKVFDENHVRNQRGGRKK